MYAASEGKSSLGITKKVAKEFVAADSGGKLPERKPSKLYDHPRSTSK